MTSPAPAPGSRFGSLALRTAVTLGAIQNADGQWERLKKASQQGDLHAFKQAARRWAALTPRFEPALLGPLVELACLASNHAVEMIDFLIALGADPLSETTPEGNSYPIENALLAGRWEAGAHLVKRLVLECHNEDRALFFRAADADERPARERLRRALRAGATAAADRWRDADTTEMTYFFKAALPASLPPSARANLLAEVGGRSSPLAMASPNAAAVSLLLAAGADPNARAGMGESALERAVLRGAPDCVQTLISAGADARVKARALPGPLGLLELAWERTPPTGPNWLRIMGDPRDTELLWAGIIAQLARAGADPNSKDAHGKSLLARAVTAEAHRVAAVLFEHGADPQGLDPKDLHQLQAERSSRLPIGSACLSAAELDRRPDAALKTKTEQVLAPPQQETEPALPGNLKRRAILGRKPPKSAP